MSSIQYFGCLEAGFYDHRHFIYIHVSGHIWGSLTNVDKVVALVLVLRRCVKALSSYRNMVGGFKSVLAKL